jgi:hypothetical protein
LGNPACRFRVLPLRSWHGRYARIAGNSSVFHIHTVHGRLWPVILWATGEGLGTCVAIKCDAAAGLVAAVAGAKHHAGGGGGGAFLVNEFGQVLVPASDGGGRRYLVGELEGNLLFENPFGDEDVDLSECGGLRAGDPWDLPYVGLPFNLSSRSRIYFYQTNRDRGLAIYPPQQDTNLIEALRSVRRSGAARFIVNPAGLVLTKRPAGERWSPEEEWQPVFVGRINRRLWFEKE